MDDETRRRLLAIGRDFYERHADSFDETRRRPWPGWDRVLSHLPAADPLRVLDVGCGNGRFAEHLERGVDPPGRVRYLGIDSSHSLLEAARHALAESVLGRVTFRRMDAFDLVDHQDGPYELITLFGVLHHLPGATARRRLLRSLAARLAPGGWLAVTVWRLDRSPRRFARLHVPWEAWNQDAPAGLRVDPARLEAGDALLRWRGDASVPRYAHFPGDDEIAATIDALGELPGVELRDRYLCDGPSSDPPRHGDNLYLLWRRGRAC